jgi:hypothetical protein
MYSTTDMTAKIIAVTGRDDAAANGLLDSAATVMLFSCG